jgi:group I intron endonuclease
MSIGIYKITSPSGKIYVGQSINIEKRWVYYYNVKCKSQSKLYNSLLKYGSKNHKFEVIEECFVEQLDEREIYWGNYYNVLSNTGLNLRLGNLRGKWSKETLVKMSKSQLGKIKGDYHSKEFKQKISNIQKGNKNRLNIKHSNETKQKISKANSKPNLKLNKPVIQYDLQGNFIQEWESTNQIKKTLNINPTGVSLVLNNKQKTAYGYIWKFKKNN